MCVCVSGLAHAKLGSSRDDADDDDDAEEDEDNDDPTRRIPERLTTQTTACTFMLCACSV